MPDPAVHNHGPEEGRGLACNEALLPDGSRRGACLAASEPATGSTGAEAPTGCAISYCVRPLGHPGKCSPIPAPAAPSPLVAEATRPALDERRVGDLIDIGLCRFTSTTDRPGMQVAGDFAEIRRSLIDALTERNTPA